MKESTPDSVKANQAQPLQVAVAEQGRVRGGHQ